LPGTLDRAKPLTGPHDRSGRRLSIAVHPLHRIAVTETDLTQTTMAFFVFIVSIGLLPAFLAPTRGKPFAAWWLCGSVLSLAAFLTAYFLGEAPSF
jgi:hypothetical protein